MLKKLLVLLLFFLPAFSYGQNFEWGVDIGYKNGEQARGVSTDKSGNSYVIGYFLDSIYFGSHLLIGKGVSSFIAKYNSSGNFIWAKAQYGRKATYGQGIITDSVGNVFIFGNYTENVIFSPSDTFSDNLGGNFLAKYDSSGKFLWGVHSGGGGLTMSLDKQNNIYLVGEGFNTVYGHGSHTITGPSRSADFVAKYDSLGNIKWLHLIYGSLSIYSTSIGKSFPPRQSEVIHCAIFIAGIRVVFLLTIG